MEDIDISNRLKKVCDPEILDGNAITSSQEDGKRMVFLRTILLMRLIRLLFYLGVNTKIN